jgi:hypothetical protein
MLGYGGQIEHIDGIEGSSKGESPSLNKESEGQDRDMTVSDTK